MNKFSRTARSVTFAAIVGLSMGISAPAVIAQPEGPAVEQGAVNKANIDFSLSLIHISEPTRLSLVSRMPSSA